MLTSRGIYRLTEAVAETLLFLEEHRMRIFDLVCCCFLVVAMFLKLGCAQNESGHEKARLQYKLVVQETDDRFGLKSTDMYSEDDWPEIYRDHFNELSAELDSANQDLESTVPEITSAYDFPDVYELRNCAKRFGVSRSRLIVLNSDQNIGREDIGILKVSGDRGGILLNVTQQGRDAELGGLCVIAGGKQVQLEVNLGANIEQLVYIASGEQSTGIFHVGLGYNLYNLSGELTGLSSRMTIYGGGAFPCETVDLRGVQSQFICRQ